MNAEPAGNSTQREDINDILCRTGYGQKWPAKQAVAISRLNRRTYGPNCIVDEESTRHNSLYQRRRRRAVKRLANNKAHQRDLAQEKRATEICNAISEKWMMSTAMPPMGLAKVGSRRLEYERDLLKARRTYWRGEAARKRIQKRMQREMRSQNENW